VAVAVEDGWCFDSLPGVTTKNALCLISERMEAWIIGSLQVVSGILKQVHLCLLFT
jgi:hypothetical protein